MHLQQIRKQEARWIVWSLILGFATLFAFIGAICLLLFLKAAY